MDRDRYSSIAHAGLAYCNPISHAKAEQLIDLLDLPKGAWVIDIGCGKAELLIRLVERYGVRAVGVDRSARFLDEARRRAQPRVPGPALSLHQADAAEFLDRDTGRRYAAALCIGSTHALGGLRQTLARLPRRVEPGGWVLLGDGYWKQPPPAEYLQALGASADDYLTHAGNLDLLVRAGLIPLHACTATQDEWDQYEWAYLRGIEAHAAAHPEDPDGPGMLDRARTWRDVVARWGRDTLGFGLYLAKVPPASAL